MPGNEYGKELLHRATAGCAVGLITGPSPTQREMGSQATHFSCAYHFEEEDEVRWSRWGYDNWFSTRQWGPRQDKLYTKTSFCVKIILIKIYKILK